MMLSPTLVGMQLFVAGQPDCEESLGSSYWPDYRNEMGRERGACHCDKMCPLLKGQFHFSDGSALRDAQCEDPKL